MSQIVEASTAEQIEQVRNLFLEYRAQLPVEYCFRAFDDEVAGLPGTYSPPRGTLLLATVLGQPVGCVGLRPFPREGTCEMKRLYVRPAFRGDRLGIKLTERALMEARRIGYSSVRLDSYASSMQAAVEMYRKFGFREVDSDPLEPAPGLIYMELPLRSS
ncbi:MAG TPA: GNAT family N-acetyltransferase [Candidatus Binatia bacterium]|nr:GNAT family N-acetyltransferase [Candidatus Binatia bacterium]